MDIQQCQVLNLLWAVHSAMACHVLAGNIFEVTGYVEDHGHFMHAYQG
jgi:hypothetical protein